MIYLICGQKGTGKSLFTISFLRKKIKQYDYIFSNFPVKFAKKLDSYDWVFNRFPKRSAILIDEAQLYYNSREFSRLTKNGVGNQLLDYLTMCRHYDVDVFFITQSSNRIDLQIRELADIVIYLKRTFKIPFIAKPFLTFGLRFSDILEFEKYMNPNNFGCEFRFSYCFKFIKNKDLKQYDTHYIDKSYYQKDIIDIVDWSKDQEKKEKIFYRIKVKLSILLFKIINYFKRKNNVSKKDMVDVDKYF